jgi:hypothetical protein
MGTKIQLLDKDRIDKTGKEKLEREKNIINKNYE